MFWCGSATVTPGTFLLTHGHLDPVALPPQEPTGLAAEAEVHHFAFITKQRRNRVDWSVDWRFKTFQEISRHFDTKRTLERDWGLQQANQHDDAWRSTVFSQFSPWLSCSFTAGSRCAVCHFVCHRNVSNWHRHSMALEFVWFGSWSLGASLNTAIIWQSWMAIWQSWQSWWHHARPCPSVTQCHREHSQCWKVMNHDSHDSVCKPWAKRIHPMQFLTWLIADKVLWFECFLMRFNASELNCLTSLIESNI